MLVGDVVSSHVKFKTPGTASNSNFMQAINRNVMSVEKTGTYGSYGLLNQGKQPTLNSLAKNYGGSESNAFFKPMMSKDTLNNQISGSQLGSISEQQTFNQIGSKQGGQSFNKGVQKSEVESSLDWSRYSNRTKGSADHHIKMNHGQLRLDKEQQSVFYGDPIKTVENSWEVVKQKNIAPIRQDYADIYIIPKSNVGYDGGIGGQRTNLNYITLVVEKETKKVITAYPSGATPSLPKDYLPFTTDFSKVQK